MADQQEVPEAPGVLFAEGESPEAVETQASAEEPVTPGDVSLRGFDGQMVLLTWVAFAVAFAVLTKVLWKPLLGFLEARESEIRASLDDAEKARVAAAHADAMAAETIAKAEREARAAAEAQTQTARQYVAELENSAREAIAERRKAAEAALAAERESALRALSEQAGGEIAHALETFLPGMLTEEQRQAYQDQIAAQVNFR